MPETTHPRMTRVCCFRHCAIEGQRGCSGCATQQAARHIQNEGRQPTPYQPPLTYPTRAPATQVPWEQACSLRPIPFLLAYDFNSRFTWAKDLGQGSAFCRAGDSWRMAAWAWLRPAYSPFSTTYQGLPWNRV